MIRFTLALFTVLLLASPLLAQRSLEGGCEHTDIQELGARDECLAAVQAATSAQPALGLLISGGNPTIGSSGAAGFRLGFLPRLTAGLRLNLVALRLPEIIADEIRGGVGDLTRRFGAPIPALNADASIALIDGFSIAPGLGGIGALSLLGSASYLPFNLLGADGFEDAPDFAFGLGGRVHLLQESFIAPGISLSVTRRSVKRVQFGDICPGAVAEVPVPGASPPRTFTGCTSSGDRGEFSFDLTTWNGRLVASKHLLGFGLAAGIGHDRNGSDVGYGFRGDAVVPGTNATPAFRIRDQELESTRWSVFGNASFSLLVGTIGAEAGWQQGRAPITGFDSLGSDFDPRSGTWFGSLGARLSL